MNISISKHANERMKERLPGMKSAARRYETACKAFFCGARQDSCRGAEAAYLASYIKQEPEYFCRDLLLYMDRIFVFEGKHAGDGAAVRRKIRAQIAEKPRQIPPPRRLSSRQSRTQARNLTSDLSERIARKAALKRAFKPAPQLDRESYLKRLAHGTTLQTAVLSKQKADREVRIC